MGGGGSKPAEPQVQKTPEPAKPSKKDQRELAGAHSAPPTYNLERRGSMMPMDAVGKAPKESSNDLRRGNMAPSAGPGKNPNQESNNLMSTHGAMRRKSNVAKLKLTRDKVGRLGQDEFGFDDDDEQDDSGAFGGLKHVPSSPKEEEPPSIKFGRKANTINAAAIVGNEAGGDLSNAALSNLQTGVVKGNERANVAETTATGRKQKAFFVNDDDLEDEPVKATSALGKIKMKAKTASVANDLQRRQTARELGGTLNGTKSGMNLKEDDVPVVNGTTRVKTLLENMKQFRYTMRAKRDMSDSDIQDLQQQQEQYGRVKLHVAAEITSLGRKIDILPPQVKAMCVEFVHSIIIETDRREGNTELVTVFLKHLFSIEWVAAIHTHEWLFISARDGSAKFFDILLATPMLGEGEYHMDFVELLRICVQHKAQRLPLTFVFMKHWATLGVSELRDEMQPLFQTIFVEAGSHKRAIPNEDRTPRMNLLNKILSLSHMIRIDFCAPDGDDGLSILQRCVAEGDTTLMNAIVGNAVGVKWNHVYADGHTILSTAVQANHKLIVELLLGCRDLDVFQFLPVCNGHVLDFARKQKSLPAIIAAIEHRMKILAPSSETADPTKMSFIQKKRTQAAKESTGPILPDFLTRVDHVHTDPDWIIDTSSKSIVATDEICKLVLGIELHCQELARAKKDLLASEAAEARYFELAEALPPLKIDVANKIMEIGTRICVEGKDAKDLVLQTVHDLLTEQEVEGNCMLIRVLVYRIITVDFAPYLTDRHWVLQAVSFANLEIAESLLRVSKVWQEEDVVALVNAAMAHHVKRMPLMNLLLRFAEQLRMATHSDHLRTQFQEFFELITHQAKLVVGEDRSTRKEVLYRMAHAKFISLQYEQEFTGSQTIFSRACREGDIEVVEVMLNMRMLRDVNRIHSNKSTALMQAVVGNQVEVVRMLARDPTVDVHVVSPHGTALDLAVKMRKDPAIIEELKKAGA